jgi:hypothetical protein
MCGSAYVESRHHQEQQAGREGNPAHAGQVLDDGHGAGHGARRQQRLEQVHPERGVTEGKQVGGDEAEDHV